VLQLHRHAVFFVDRAAATQLRRRDYYQETWSAKPAWQLL
jgi:glucosamine-6-phosphate deaminase